MQRRTITESGHAGDETSRPRLTVTDFERKTHGLPTRTSPTMFHVKHRVSKVAWTRARNPVAESGPGPGKNAVVVVSAPRPRHVHCASGCPPAILLPRRRNVLTPADENIGRSHPFMFSTIEWEVRRHQTGSVRRFHRNTRGRPTTAGAQSVLARQKTPLERVWITVECHSLNSLTWASDDQTVRTRQDSDSHAMAWGGHPPHWSVAIAVRSVPTSNRPDVLPRRGSRGPPVATLARRVLHESTLGSDRLTIAAR